MRKTLSSVVIFLFTSIISSQENIITNLLDAEGHITTERDRAFHIETITKNDSVWEVRKLNRSGNLISIGSFLDEEKRIPVGIHRTFFKNGIETEELSYNNKGERDGVCKRWFYDGKKNSLGIYQNGNMVGLWKYFHRNGKIACVQIYDKGILIKTTLYDEEGNKMLNENPIVFSKAEYEKGEDKFKKKIKGIHEFVGYQINGYIFIDFIVDEQGNIIDLDTVATNIPSNLMREFKIYLENKSDWKPAISMNRKVPTYFCYGLDFRVN